MNWLAKNIYETRSSIKKHRQLFYMLIPVFVFFFIFSYIPMYGAIIAFKDYSIDHGIWSSSWTGLENFRRLFETIEFRNALSNTIVISLLRLSFGFAAPIILALLLNEIRINWYKRTIQTLTYLPYFFSWVILGGIFLMVFSHAGPINFFLETCVNGLNNVIYVLNLIPFADIAMIKFDAIQFMTSDTWFIIILIATGIWQAAGYAAVIYLAALAGIPTELYEAATVDGAGRWKQTIHITLPCLLPTIITLFILRLGYVLNAGFDQIYNMYNPMVYDSADIIDTYVLRMLQTMDFSLATAAGLFKSIVGMILLVVVNSLVNKFSKNQQGIW